MLLIVAYIVGCFLGALALKDRESRRPRWVLLGSCAFLCVVYLTADQIPLPGFSLSSLAVGETHGSDRPATRRTEEPSATGAFAPTARESTLAARIGGGLYLLGAVAILARPRYGLYLILFCSLIGDAVLLPWYPFVKGFSARESLFFVHDALIISPLELYILLIGGSWFARQMWQNQLRFYTGQLFWPALVFLAFILFGLAYGIGTGGDLRIALWEARAIFYLAALLVLTSNLIEKPTHVSHVMWMAMAALLVKGIYSSLYYLSVLKGDLRGIEGISEHAAAIHLNTLFVLSLVVWIYRTSRMKRVLLPLMIPFVILGYIAMQRRAAFVTVAIAFVLVAALLYKTHRRVFRLLAPTFAVLGVCYVAVFWNSQSLPAVPAQAIKSVIAAEQPSEEEQSSNNYRVLENRNIIFTIHSHPLAGVGFGQKFYIIAPMDDISALFEWWEYITHNSIMWMWMKAGIGGFCAMLFLIGMAVVAGVRALARLPGDDLSAAVLTATLYIVMHFIYACVDMSWDEQSMVYVGAMMGLVNSAERIGNLAAGGSDASACRTGNRSDLFAS
jgi:hypothetical protein